MNLTKAAASSGYEFKEATTLFEAIVAEKVSKAKALKAIEDEKIAKAKAIEEAK